MATNTDWCLAEDRMSKTTKIVLGVVGGVVLLCVVVSASASAGMFFSRFGMPMGLASAVVMRPFVQVQPDTYGQPYRMPMFGQSQADGFGDCPYADECPRQRGDGGRWLPGQDDFRMPFGRFGLDPEDEFGPGGMMGPGGRMWGFALGTEPSAEPLSVEQAVASAEAYLAGIEASDLEVAEVMVFDNHAYVEVKDPATGEGAIELLVDPVSQRAMLEFGPSMMWNTTYGMHNAARMHGGMMGQAFGPETAPQGEMTVTPVQAAEAAQAYLDEAFAGQTVSDEVETFPGYYTLHVLENGEVVGMMSVNGYTGQVWYHSWHGNLLEMQEFGE